MMKCIKTSLAIFIFSAAANATSIDAARTIENSTNAAAIVSQDKIDVHADTSMQMKAEIEQLQEEVNNLQIYHDHLARLVQNQQQEMTSIHQQIGNIKETRQGVIPLMYGMIEGLAAIVAKDIPIKQQHRLTRVTTLDTMMAQANISDAEKFRRILEAYQIEMDYGTKLGTYQDKITLANSKTIEVELLYVGRMVLVARNVDGSRYWLWSRDTQQWQIVKSNDAVNINAAYAMANNQISPSLLRLPLSGSLITAEQP